MEDKTSKPGFNKSGGAEKPKIHRNHSNYTLIQSIDRMTLTATKAQKKHMLAIKDQYLKRKVEKDTFRAARPHHYQMGISAGIHLHIMQEKLDKQDKVQDQSERNRIIDKAKDYYHQNYSLSKKHKDAQTRTKPKEKDMIKE